jgi:DNA (cytosine-5)-methyltransferase 1
MFRHVDLCSGIGGFALGFEWAGLSKPVLFCDIEEWPRKILAKHWPDVPIAEDVKELANDPDRNVPDCDILTAGYPCQPFSLAGERRGAEDDRHIWPDIFSIVQRKRPAWCVFENVYGHISMGLDEVLSDLELESYSVRPFIVPACATDAPHRRDRVWIIARNVGDSNSRASQGIDSGRSKPTKSGSGFKSGCENVADSDSAGLQGTKRQGETRAQGSSSGHAAECSEDVADTKRQRQQGQRPQGDASNQETDGEGQAAQSINGGFGNFWLPEPAVGRVANGVPRRVDRLKGLGNAIVPQVAQRIGETIKQIEAKGG